MQIEITLLTALIILSGLFSASEAAILSISRIKLKYLIKNKGKTAQIQSLIRLKENSQKTIMTILIGNNVVNISAAFLASHITVVYFGDIYLGIAGGILTLLILVFAEIIPKNYASANASKIALLICQPIEWIEVIFSPLIWIFEKISHIFAIDDNTYRRKIHFSEDELRSVFDLVLEDRTISKDEKKFFERVLDFNDTFVKEIMTPESEVKYISSEDSYKKIFEKVMKYKKSRYPVIDGKTQKVIGVITIKRLFSSKPKTPLSKIMIKPFFVSKEMRAFELFKKMQKTRTHIAIILDSNGDMDGIVTLEDLVEEVVGEIETETAKAPVQQTKSSLVVSGDGRLHDIEKELGIMIAESDHFGSISAFLHYQLKRLPIRQDVIIIGKIRMEVLEVDDDFRMQRIKIDKID